MGRITLRHLPRRRVPDDGSGSTTPTERITVPQRKLSFGQRKRCELAAALLHDPKIILLDEPTNAMDLLSAGRVRQFVREEARVGNRAGIGRTKTLTLLGAPGFRDFHAGLRRMYGAWVEPLDYPPECEGEDILGQCRNRYAGEILLAEDLLRVSV